MLVMQAIIEKLEKRDLLNKTLSKALKEIEKELDESNESCNIPFGKYKGKTVCDVLAFDRKYLVWLNKQEYVSKFKDLKNELSQVLN